MAKTLDLPPRPELARSAGQGQERSPSVRSRWDRAISWLSFAILGTVALLPLAGNEVRTQNVDPMFLRNIVERTAELGGTFYSNGIYNKGWLEPAAYTLVRNLTSYNGFWLGISALAMLLAAVIAWAAARTVRVSGGGRVAALAIAAVVYIHFTIGRPQYAGVVYSRNLTVTILALVWIVALSDPFWSTPRRALVSSIAVGGAMGLAAQSLLTTALPGAAVGLGAAALLHHRGGRPWLLKYGVAAAASALAVLLSAPVWYALRGSLAEFWASWWTYARFMSTGTGRPLADQFTLGWEQIAQYYRPRPMVVLLLAAFALYGTFRWRKLNFRARLIHLTLAGWFAGAWLELIISQRYSEHYFAVLAVPTALIGAVLAGRLASVLTSRFAAARRAVEVPLVATLLALVFLGHAHLGEVTRATSAFRGVEELKEQRAKEQGGHDRTVRAILDLASGHNDALLAWTIDPTVYLKYERIPASRLQWRSFMLGEIYLGQTSTDYVLPDTWRWLAQDVEQSKPAAFVETESFSSNTPFEELIRTEFTQVYAGSPTKVWLLSRSAREILDQRAFRQWSVPQGGFGPGWTVTGNDAQFAGDPSEQSELTLATGNCFRLEGTADVIAAGEQAKFVLRFDSLSNPGAERLYLTLEGDQAGSGSSGLGPLGYEALGAAVTGDGPVEFSVIAGRESVVLVVAGQVQAALRLPEPVRMSIEARNERLELKHLRIGAPPPATGCAG
ncbi:MAG: hypothetical protein ACT4OM_11445 [Actinomycetota bacterium]